MKLGLIALLVSCVCASAQMGVRSPALLSTATKKLATGGTTTFSPPVAGYFALFDADSITAANGSSVSTWTDLSRSLTANQGTAGNRPYFTNACVNGHSALYFDGGDYLQCAEPSDRTTVAKQTIFIVAQFLDAADDYVLVGATNGNSYIRFNGFGASSFRAYYGVGIDGSDGSSDWTATSWSVYTMVCTNSANSALFTNGVATLTGDVGSVYNQGIELGASAGGAAAMKGRIALYLIYTNSLTVVDRQSTESALKTRFATP